LFYVPLGYKVEYLPKNISLESNFGKYSYHLESKSDQIVFIRSLELNKSDIPVEKFSEFKEFINSVA
jgi:hypothetical protein